MEYNGKWILYHGTAFFVDKFEISQNCKSVLRTFLRLRVDQERQFYLICILNYKVGFKNNPNTNTKAPYKRA